MVSGAIQIILGLLKTGRYAKLLPSSVLHGILAAIGVIIFAKQIHFTLGTTSDTTSTIGTLIDVIYKIPDTNPFILMISLTGILILVFYKKIRNKTIQMVPAPMWVLVLSLPFVFGFDFFSEHDITLFGNDYIVGPDFLIEIPNNPLECIMYPDFSMVDTVAFWLTVISITLIASY